VKQIKQADLFELAKTPEVRWVGRADMPEETPIAVVAGIAERKYL